MATATSRTAMILAIKSAATGPARIRRPRNTLLSWAPTCKPSRVVSMSSNCRTINTVNDGVGKCLRVPRELGKLMVVDSHSDLSAAPLSTLSFVRRLHALQSACMAIDLVALAKFDTPTISNTIELFAVRPRTAGYMDGRVRACFPEMPPAVGYAATATMRCALPHQEGCLL